MAKIDKHLLGMGAYHAEVAAQDELDKVKNEERCKSLSIALGRGSNLIVVSEFDRRYCTNPGPDKYSLFVTKPGAGDTHVSIVLETADVHALIDILEKIIDEE